MIYWHMQLHYDHPIMGNEVDILKKTSLIGLGEWEKGQPQIDSFKREMQIGDIVLVKRGRLAIALVEVVGEAQYEPEPNEDLDWFQNRRKVKILEILETKKYDFPQPRGTLSKSINKNTKTYQYINDWYNRLVSRPSPSRAPAVNISGIYIENSKMFVDFKLSFLNKTGEVFPLIVLAGINGSGKTTLLEYIEKFDTQTKFKGRDYIDYLDVENTDNDKATVSRKLRRIYKSSSPRPLPNMPLPQKPSKTRLIPPQKPLKRIYETAVAVNHHIEKAKITEFRNSIRYFPVTANFTKDTQELIVTYANRLIKNHDYRPSEAYKSIDKILKDIFSSLDLHISFSRLDEKDNVFFKNQEGREFYIDELSTGEKTLLSKVFHLYIGDYAGKIILIDEPELSLHPSWQSEVLSIYENFCKRHNSQVIIATHSPQIIGSARRECLRILSLHEGKVKVIEDLPSYGRDVNWVLENVMGVPSIRPDKIAKRIEDCQKLLNEEKYDECERVLDDLESEIGEDDTEVLRLRNILFFEQD